MSALFLELQASFAGSTFKRLLCSNLRGLNHMVQLGLGLTISLSYFESMRTSPVEKRRLSGDAWMQACCNGVGNLKLCSSR